MKPALRVRRTQVALALCLISALAACGGPSAQESLQAAQSSLAKQDQAAAIVQLKNALQQDPNLLEARLLMGKTLLDRGEAAAAIVELDKARNLGAPGEEVIPALARALLANGQHDRVLSDFGTETLAGAGAKADLYGSLAMAHMAAGNQLRAREFADKSLALDAKQTPPLMLLAGLAAEEKQYQRAHELIDRAIAVDPRNPLPLIQKSELIFKADGDLESVIALLNKAIELQPDSLMARSAMVLALLKSNNTQAAQAHIDALKKGPHAKHPQTAYLEAQAAFSAKQWRVAHTRASEALKAYPDRVDVLHLAGAIHFENGELLESERLLAKALSLQPDLDPARRRLAVTQLRMGQAQKALNTLRPLINRGDTDAQTYALAGEALVMSGQADAATQQLTQAVKFAPDNIAHQVQLLLARRSKAGDPATLAGLKDLALKDKGSYADLILISLLSETQQFASALAAIENLQRKLPADSPLAFHLRGKVELAAQSMESARKSFARALEIDPMHVPSAAALAGMDLQDNKPDDAKKRFASIIKADPKNLVAQLAIVKIRRLEKAPPQELQQSLEGIVRDHPGEPGAWSELITQLMATKEHKAALNAAQKAAVALPDRPDLMDLLGRAQLASGDYAQAMTTYKRMAALEPYSPRAQLRIAATQLAAKDTGAAEQTLRQALGQFPGNLTVLETQYALALARQQSQEAANVARQIQKVSPTILRGYELEAELSARRSDAPGIVRIYTAALKSNPDNTLAAIKLHGALLRAGNVAEAERMAKSRKATHPKDLSFVAATGDQYMAAGIFAQAEQQFRTILAQHPNHTGALNNLAWVLAAQNKPGALEPINRAISLSSRTAPLLDTLAWVQASEKLFDQALKTQREAMALSPEDPTLRLNLAKLMARSGDIQGARLELEALTKLGDKFGGQGEVKALLGQVK
ncbi:XrtA/PEP-CTERM system TPR-repeat protein PrsT [Roseateles sp.]|jgi:putative PEP-CTERM system TPR-repeat lipoprotein|uniref:XrtA/PEP-CTERM system TPR-repeat protein PrsT n=1 Tax=Roseateles sp. TaxID=1971397 RepID=UPI00391911FB